MGHTASRLRDRQDSDAWQTGCVGRRRKGVNPFLAARRPQDSQSELSAAEHLNKHIPVNIPSQKPKCNTVESYSMESLLDTVMGRRPLPDKYGRTKGEAVTTKAKRAVDTVIENVKSAVDVSKVALCQHEQGNNLIPCATRHNGQCYADCRFDSMVSEGAGIDETRQQQQQQQQHNQQQLSSNAESCEHIGDISLMELPPSAVDHMLNNNGLNNTTHSTTSTANTNTNTNTNANTNTVEKYTTFNMYGEYQQPPQKGAGFGNGFAGAGNVATGAAHFGEYTPPPVAGYRFDINNGSARHVSHNRDDRGCTGRCLWNTGNPLSTYNLQVHPIPQKPEYNSLCTKCMPEEDKVSGNYKGLLIHSPVFKHVNDPRPQGMSYSTPTSPRFNKSNIVHQSALINGKSIHDVYYLDEKCIGKGSYGSVMRARHRDTGEERAVKVIQKDKITNAMRMKREIQIMKTLDHPNIIKLYEVHEDAVNLYLVMEMCSGGELFDHIVKHGCFSERNAAIIMRQIFSAICYCQSKNVMHRDLKPENILYSNTGSGSSIKIIDWGFATKCYKSHKFSSLVGTPYYVAPEVLLGNYDKGCDVWSAGVILFILLVGYPPFHGKDHAAILRSVKRGSIHFVPHHWRNVSREAIELITKCLSYDPRYRISAKDAWNHPWILKNIKSPQNSPGHVTSSLSRDLIKRFKEFHKYNKMKKLALTCIAYHLNESDVGSLSKAFEALNTKGDGVLSISDMIYSLQGSHNRRQKSPDPATERLIAQLDTDGSGTIDYTAFLAAAIDERLYRERDFCKRAFNVFDLQGRGRITKRDMIEILKRDARHVGQEREMVRAFVEDIFNEVDLDNDGEIDFNEFCAMLFGFVDHHQHPRRSGRRAKRGPQDMDKVDVDVNLDVNVDVNVDIDVDVENKSGGGSGKTLGHDISLANYPLLTAPTVSETAASTPNRTVPTSPISYK